MAADSDDSTFLLYLNIYISKEVKAKKGQWRKPDQLIGSPVRIYSDGTRWNTYPPRITSKVQPLHIGRRIKIR